jgi:CBS-domain-containing membrane protein
MSKRLETLSETDTIAKAARLMAEVGIGFLPICDAEDRVLGVVTDRDLVTRAVAAGLNVETTTAAAIMSKPPVTCLADADLRLAEELMSSERKARVVLTDERGGLVGVVSIADIVEHAPKREALQTIQSVLWREALGPRAGAPAWQPLLADLPRPAEMPEADRPHPSGNVFTGGNHAPGLKEFPA